MDPTPVSPAGHRNRVLDYGPHGQFRHDTHHPTARMALPEPLHSNRSIGAPTTSFRSKMANAASLDPRLRDRHASHSIAQASSGPARDPTASSVTMRKRAAMSSTQPEQVPNKRAKLTAPMQQTSTNCTLGLAGDDEDDEEPTQEEIKSEFIATSAALQGLWTSSTPRVKTEPQSVKSELDADEPSVKVEELGTSTQNAISVDDDVIGTQARTISQQPHEVIDMTSDDEGRPVKAERGIKLESVTNAGAGVPDNAGSMDTVHNRPAGSEKDRKEARRELELKAYRLEMRKNKAQYDFEMKDIELQQEMLRADAEEEEEDVKLE
ncbi:hypothetical protein CLAFUW4_03440 [Fulvia fulva]|nr:hypothetical protein CLAFUR4_03429 [Fulvia fulva]WPV11467.1 hypothetical protein CLAFUW4_03440 [Fulvia fulva]WPV25769.1 hypothetical protein CLAFUW7_03432 [Fulvia fulva]